MRLRLPRIADAKDYILAALVLVFAISLMISRHEGGLQNVRKVSVTILSYLEQPLATIRVYRQALNTNTNLQRQNVRLQDDLSRLRAAQQQNNIFRQMLGFQDSSDYDLEPVTVVSKELNSMNNSLTISAGAGEGVKVGMPVLNADGLIGNITLTTGTHSLVRPFANSLYNVSAQVQDSRATGIVSWEGNRYDELVLRYIPQTIDVQPGQVVETFGSNQYPKGIPIGEVTRVVPQEGVETQLIYLRPYVNLHTVAEGFVVLFEPSEGIEELQLRQQGEATEEIRQQPVEEREVPEPLLQPEPLQQEEEF